MRTKLNENESLILETKKHWFSYLWIIIFLASLISLGIALVIFSIFLIQVCIGGCKKGEESKIKTVSSFPAFFIL